MNVNDLLKDNGKLLKQIKQKWKFDEVTETIGVISIINACNNDLNKVESYYTNQLCYSKKDVDLAMENFYKVIKLFKMENEIIGLKDKR
jgi:hypothetical protein